MLAVWLAIGGCTVLAQTIGIQRPSEEDREKLTEEFFGPRVAGSANPARDRVAAVREMRRMQSLRAAAPQAITDSSWASIGPRPITRGNFGNWSGRISAFAYDPRNVSRMYLGTANGGVWRSRNAGGSWDPVTDDMPSLAIGAIAVDPTNPDTVYAASGDPNGFYGAGIYVTNDAGDTWSQIPGPFGEGYGAGRFRSLAIHPQTGVLYAGLTTNGRNNAPVGLWRYTPGTGEWKYLHFGPAHRIVFDPRSPDTMYLTTAAIGATTTGIYKSTDAGATWAALNGTGSNKLAELMQAGRLELAIANSDPNTMYALLAAGNAAWLYKTTDGGANWRKLVMPDFCASQCIYDGELAVHPTNASVVYLGGVGLYRTMDGGATWTSVNIDSQQGSAYVDTHALVFSPDGSRLYVGNDAGIFSISGTTVSDFRWANLNNNIGLLLVRGSIGMHPSDLNFAFAPTQDLTLQRYTGSIAWNGLFASFFGGGCGDAGNVEIDPITPAIAYMTCFNGILWKSVDKGLNWNQIQGVIGTTERHLGSPPIAMDPTNGRRLFYGTYRVWMSPDAGASWSAISPDLASTQAAPGAALAGLSLSGSVLYSASTSGRVFVTLNAGPQASWQEITGPWRATGVRVAADPADPQHAVVAVSGYFDQRVFESHDAGANWSDITGNLPLIPVVEVILDPSQTSAIYVGTDIGVFGTKGGLYWEPVGSGMPVVSITSLRLHQTTRTLRAGTYGRGLYDITIPVPPACSYQLDTVVFEVSADAQTLEIPLTAPDGCGWLVQSNIPWAALTSDVIGMGAASVFLDISANDSDSARSATLGIAGQTVTILQDAPMVP